MQSYNVLYPVGRYVHGVSGNRLLISGIIEQIIISSYMTVYCVRDDQDNKLYKIQENKIISTDE